MLASPPSKSVFSSIFLAVQALHGLELSDSLRLNANIAWCEALGICIDKYAAISVPQCRVVFSDCQTYCTTTVARMVFAFKYLTFAFSLSASASIFARHAELHVARSPAVTPRAALPEPNILEALFARQAGACAISTDTLCPDGSGCCSSGAACYTSNGVGLCSQACPAGGPVCTFNGGVAGCCNVGDACGSTACIPGGAGASTTTSVILGGATTSGSITGSATTQGGPSVTSSSSEGLCNLGASTCTWPGSTTMTACCSSGLICATVPGFCATPAPSLGLNSTSVATVSKNSTLTSTSTKTTPTTSVGAATTVGATAAPSKAIGATTGASWIGGVLGFGAMFLGV
ncbi:hypothetical protein BT63DRAFT_426098 [Microthyrium microscopicum]|uniref:Uncharacterized protein n=1 Tax=Microthyrium microscopicum TaxID=703497 RepID=A0A6A6U986_9PEZI|nr:hypothetical protein BT63DRAFT_426098 [Microthyrium microscopicum]